jgi:predicted site-specific integrase-resolvase
MKSPAFYFADHPIGQREQPLTTRQLADHLQVTMRCLANWRAEGRIPFWRLTPRCLRYCLSEVEAALGKTPNE